MPQTELKKFDDETEELKAKYEILFQAGLFGYSFVMFLLIALGSAVLSAVLSNAYPFSDKAPLTLRALQYLNTVAFIAFAGALAAVNKNLIGKLFRVVGLWMHVAQCLIIVLHTREINEVPNTIIVLTGFVTLSIFSLVLYSGSHELAKRQRMRSRMIIDAGLSGM